MTADNQILVELAPDEATRPNLFDLNERTVVFTPDGTGRYSREVKALEWEEEIGEEIEYNAVIMLESFDFPFAGHRWDSFHLGPPGVMTFGGPFTYRSSYYGAPMQEIADEFISSPTISASYKPRLYGTRHVARWTDRIVVTWSSKEHTSWVHGVPPEKFARIQAVLSVDGSIRFSYIDVPFRDGIIGLFQNVDLTERLPTGVDLSQSDSQVSNRHHEVFHYRSVPSTSDIACRLIGVLGEAFDLFVFHSEFRLDTGWSVTGTPWTAWSFLEQGAVRTFWPYRPCGEGRLKGHWSIPVWIESSSVLNKSPFRKYNEGFDHGLFLFAHEFAHSWLAFYEYEKSGQREPLSFGAHWRRGLHLPAAFPWHAVEIGPSSIMGGNYWFDHGNGNFSSPSLTKERAIGGILPPFWPKSTRKLLILRRRS